jgi:hypothetical protein
MFWDYTKYSSIILIIIEDEKKYIINADLEKFE